MIFTLEALEAKHGDALLLHYGTKSPANLIVIDAGPAGVYNKRVRPRLDELKETISPNKSLPIRMVMVSHLDDDHVNGIEALTNDLVEKQDNKEEMPYDIATLWHNSFDDILSTNAINTLAASLSSAGSSGGVKPLSQALPASVGQGRRVRDNAVKLGLSVNTPFKGLVMLPKKGKKTVAIGNGLKFTVLGPDEERAEILEEEWDKQIKKLGVAKKSEKQAKAAEFVDESVFNLSSIVVLAEFGGKSMLLTGDGRGDHTISGLRRSKLLKNDKIHVNLLKLPHHGSDRNVATEYFRTITADHYVVSADGRFGNPEVATLKMISDARGSDKFTIHLTNKKPKEVMDFFKAEKKKGKKYNVVFREDDALSVKIDLGEPLKY
jgi:beta-lactamase superfamily II metal-dependent hydrolase